MITNSNQIELRHLRYFQMLASELHFRRAAEKLFISQPGLSRQIKQFESLLGCELFLRDKKQVELTLPGAFLKHEVDLLLNQIDNSLQQVQNIASGIGGSLKVGFVGSAMQNVLPELIMESTQLYPDITFSFEEMSNQVQIEKLSNGDIDIGFVRLNEVPDYLTIQAIFEDTFSLVLPKEHPLSSTNFVDMSQFKNEAFILFHSKYSPAYFDQVVSICEDSGFKPSISHNSVHASTIYRLVENGLGISIVPSSLRKGYDMAVKFIELNKIPQRAVLSMVYRQKNRNPSLRLILDIINSQCATKHF